MGKHRFPDLVKPNPRLISKKEHADHMYKSAVQRFQHVMKLRYATHIALNGGMDPNHLREVVSDFLFGWGECLGYQGDPLRIELWALAFGQITSPTWYPGPEWRFW